MQGPVIRRVIPALCILCVPVGCSRVFVDFGPKVKIEAAESLTLPAGDVGSVEVKTHNGKVTIAGTESAGDQFVVQVKKQARAPTKEGADECMAAIALITERAGATQLLGWKWDPARKPGWSASVSFDIQMPKELSVAVKTHNGGVSVSGIEGDCKLETHNGSVKVNSHSRKVDVETHNGGVRIAASPEELRLVTHNGSIHAELGGDQNVVGTIATHNGGVTIAMSESMSANFDCTTHNGYISPRLELSDVRRSHRVLTGRLGQATGTLRVETHNGSITLKPTD